MGYREHLARGRMLHHDPESRDYAVESVVPARSWAHRLGPVLDQARVNGCTGWTGADWLNWSGAIRNRRRYNRTQHQRSTNRFLGDPDGLDLYEAATRNDNLGWTYPPSDKGSTGLGVAKALQKLGVIDHYLWTFNFVSLLGAAFRQPVMLGTLWTAPMMDPDAKGIIHIGTDKQIRAADDAGEGHEYLIYRGNWPHRLAGIRNHWTADWGLGGNAWIPLDELETLVMAHRGDVCVPEVAAA